MYYKTAAIGRQVMSRYRCDIDSLAAIYRRAGMLRRGERVYQCGLFLLEVHNDMGTLSYQPMSSCDDRLCPRCARARSLRVAANAAAVAQALRQSGEYRTPYHVVLTVRNVSDNDVRPTIDVMIAACRSLLHRRSIARTVAGWGRSIEITYNAVTNTYHPHVHLLVIPTSSPDPDTIGCADWWATQWSNALVSCGHSMDYTPICHSEAAYDDGVLPEVSKYITKLSRLFRLPYEQRYRAVITIDAATRGRRLIAYGGIWAAARREMNLRDDIDASDDYAVSSGCTSIMLRWSGLEYVPYKR